MSKSRMGAPRRVATGLLAGALMIVGIAHAPAAGAADDVTSERLAGATRYGTAAAISADAAFEGATTAILATGENFPDALAASGLAGSTAATPILLTQSDELSDEALAALDDLAVDAVTVVGGTAAVSDDVVTSLEDNGYTVDRVAGDNRYGTAAAIANEVDTAGEVDGLVTALIATGENYPDALAGGPAAYAGTLPILLVNSDGVPAETEAALDSLGIEQAVILGGTAAVSDDTASDLATMTGNDVVRLAGENRFGTAAAVGEFEIDTLGFDGPSYILASGVNFPDALAGGPLGGQLGAPIVLTASLPDESAAFLDDHSDIFSEQIVLGGPAAVDEDTAAAAEAAAETTDNDTPTGGDTVTSGLEGPELQSVSISGIDVDELAITYSYVFDENLDEDVVNPGSFLLYNADSDNHATGDVFNDGEDMDISGDTAAVIFNLADYGVTTATLGAVMEGAVEDGDGNVNPPQSVETGGITNATGTGLVSVEITDEANGIAEYTFDGPQLPSVTHATLYELVDRDGTVYSANALSGSTGTAETSPSSDELSYVVEVQFLCTGAGTPYATACAGAAAGDGADLSDATIRRGVTRSNPALDFATPPANTADARINAVDISGSGNTDLADLVSIQVASDNEDLNDNQALFIFDETLDTVGARPQDFGLVYAQCDPGAAGTSLNTLINAFDGTGNPNEQDGQGFNDANIRIGGGCIVNGVNAQGGTADTTTSVVDTFGNRSVLVTFGSSVIDNEFLIAGQVKGAQAAFGYAGAGVHGTGDAVGANARDDEAEYPKDDSIYDDGEVLGPQLIGADVAVDTSVLGEFRKYVITFTFDKDLQDTTVSGGFAYWYDDGNDVQKEDLTGCEIQHDTTVVCEITDEESDLANATVVSVDAGSVHSDATYAMDRTQLNERLDNPEASAPVEVPELP